MRYTTVIITVMAAFLAGPVARALTTFSAEPYGTADDLIGVRLFARITEPINAVRLLVDLGGAEAVRFDDTDAAVRLWLTRDVSGDSVSLEGVIPGGIGPAFTDRIELGTLWMRATDGSVRVGISEALAYLNQPTPTEDEVRTIPTEFSVSTVRDAPAVTPFMTVADIRVVTESELNGGTRTLVFDIKTDQGTVETMRVRERWLGIAGVWRDASTPAPLSDRWGVSILEVSLPDTLGGARVANIIPTTLKLLWALIAVIIGTVAVRSFRKRTR